MNYKLPPLPKPRRTFERDYFTTDQMQAYAIAAIEAQRVPDGLTLAVIGREHFGNPIPQARYAAAKELLTSAPPAPQASGYGPKLMPQVSGYGEQPETIAVASTQQASKCSIGCTEVCTAKEHGCASECPALPWQPQASVVQQEPTTFLVVCTDCDGTGVDRKDYDCHCEHCKGCGRVEMDFYTHPAPQAKPLSDEQVDRLYEAAVKVRKFVTRQDFELGIRAAEAAHGIKE